MNGAGSRKTGADSRHLPLEAERGCREGEIEKGEAKENPAGAGSRMMLAIVVYIKQELTRLE